MNRQPNPVRTTLRAVLRIAALASLLCAPLAAVKSVEASSRTVIGDMHTPSSGAGLVLLISLQRG